MTSPPAIERPALRAWSIALLLVLCAIVFGRVVGFAFVWDDKNLIANNPFLRQTDTVWRAFSHGFWELTAVDHESAFYRPIVVVSYWLQWRLFDGSPAGFHAVSLLLHAANVVLVLRIALRLRLSTFAAAIAAAVFAVHPAQLVAVANVASQTDLLATLGVLGGCLLWSAEGRRRWAALPLLLLALLAKEAAIVGPVLAIGCAWVVRDRDTSSAPAPRTLRGLALAAAPFVVVVPYVVMRLLALDGALGGAGQDLPSLGGTQYAHYVTRLVLPFPEAPVIARPTPGLPLVLASGVALLGAMLLILHPRRHPRVRFAGGWFLVALLPVAEVVPLGARQNDLLLYLPLAGAALLVAHLVEARRTAQLAAGVAIVALAVISALRVGVWRDSLTLWRHGALQDPEDPAMRMNYANALRETGEAEEGCAQLGATLELLRARPNADVEVRTLYNLGNCERTTGQLAAAADHYRRAFEQSGRSLRAAGHNLAITLLELDRGAEALEVATRLVALDDNLAPSWHLLGVIHARGGRPAEAEAALERALALDPADRASRDLLAQIRASRRDQR